ncbi:hypothetical protein [Lactiplantibacillus plantarum]|uniref:hypothetical protein n=1 Tax=Lactiplantibacillus plantarum TaxID=1590 RepID=UPI001BA8846F|nr:hypothetical protein [Lactiplantibacillus plantarum]MBS0950682.1 hypothetical protein [Lactiplantibacillus plantarum]
MEVRKVSLKPKFEYEKSYSGIGSTRTARSKNKIIFTYYSTANVRPLQRLINTLRGWLA